MFKVRWMFIFVLYLVIASVFYLNSLKKSPICPKDGVYDIIVNLDKEGKPAQVMCIKRVYNGEHIMQIPYSVPSLKKGT